MNKYENGKIYRLVCNNTGLNYYGSTTQKLPQRLYEHKRSYKKYLKDNKNYFSSFEIIKEDNFKIILVELFNCSCKLELEKRERYYIDNNECINKNIPTRTKKEYYEDNKDVIIEKQKIYNDKNKDSKNQYNNDYYKMNKDIIIDKNKEYYQLNKDIIKEQRKEIYEDNKDIIKEQRKEYYQLNKDILKEQRNIFYKLNKDEINEKRRIKYQLDKVNKNIE
jgi:hypothetical protein